MRVHIAENTVVLTPYQKHILPQIPHSDVFTQLGIPQSDLAAVLITFFRQNEQPLQSRPLLKILSSLHVFAPHEKKAAFVATLLYSRGIAPSPQLITQCLTALFGFPAKQEKTAAEEWDDQDLFRFLNHVKTGKNHWVVFPFEKQLDTLWKGSAAFLLDLHDTLCRECCVRVRSEEKRKRGRSHSKTIYAISLIREQGSFRYKNKKNSLRYCTTALNLQALCPIPYIMSIMIIWKRTNPLHQSTYPCRIDQI